LNFGIKTSVGMSNLKFFEGKQIRSYWNEKEEQMPTNGKRRKTLAGTVKDIPNHPVYTFSSGRTF